MSYLKRSNGNEVNGSPFTINHHAKLLHLTTQSFATIFQCQSNTTFTQYNGIVAHLVYPYCAKE